MTMTEFDCLLFSEKVATALAAYGTPPIELTAAHKDIIAQEARRIAGIEPEDPALDIERPDGTTQRDDMTD